MWKRMISLAGIAILKAASCLPMVLLYRLSDVLFAIIYHITRYRRRTVAGNLRRSFPEKTLTELKTIEKRFYSHLCDLMVESIKTPNMSGESLNQRMIIRNPELLNRYAGAGKSVIVMAMHYGNWEWLLHMPLHIRHQQLFIYKPLQNKWFDSYVNKLRSRFGGRTTSMNIALKKIIEAEKNRVPVMTWLAADQTPPWFHPFWTIFLNQKTQFFDGPAKIARRFNHPVFFQHIIKKGRGRYETSFELLFEEPSAVPEEAIVMAYVSKLEAAIREEPAYYLWSHRRWKHQPAQGHRLYTPGEMNPCQPQIL